MPALRRLVGRPAAWRVRLYLRYFPTPACGSYNWTILILFSDGVEWVLRSSRGDDAIKCEETNVLLLASEAAILKYIKANSTIPVPKVFAYRQARALLLV